MSALRSTFLIHSAVRIDFRHFLEDQSWAYQNKMLYYLFNDWSIIIAFFTLFNALKIMKINRKCLKQKILKRSQKCQNLYYFLNMFLIKSEVRVHETLLVREYWLLLIRASRAEFPFPSFYSKASNHHSRHLLPDVWQFDPPYLYLAYLLDLSTTTTTMPSELWLLVETCHLSTMYCKCYQAFYDISSRSII